MTRLLYPFLALLLSLSVLLLGSGLLGTLLAVRMEVERFPTETIGVVMACYSIGYVMASMWFGRVLVRVGHIRAFAILAAMAAASTLIYPIIIHPIPWALMRTLLGFSVAGLYMVAESWLNSRTPREYRGRVLAFYSIATYASLGGGQFLLNLWPVEEFYLFSLSAFLLAISLIPVAMTRAPSPELIEPHPVGVRRLYELSPLGSMGSLASGIIAGGFMAMGPVFGRQVGLSIVEVSMLMGAGVLGGLLLQWPLGRLSDRYSRRLMIVGVATGVAVASVALMFVASRSEFGMMALAALWGGLAFTLYPLCLALTNDFIRHEELIGAGAGLLLMHGVGMIIGPIVLGNLMGWLGAGSLFGAIAVAAVALALFGVWRQQVGETMPVEEQSEYVAVPSTTPFAAVLDPRAEDPQLDLPFDQADAGGYGAVMLHKADLPGDDRTVDRRG